MAAPTAQQCHAMTTYFINSYREIVGKEPVVNRNKAKAGWQGMLIDFTPTQAKEVVDYYISHYENPKIDWFLYNYEKVVEKIEDAAKAKESQRLRRAETARRVQEWRERWQK